MLSEAAAGMIISEESDFDPLTPTAEPLTLWPPALAGTRHNQGGGRAYGALPPLLERMALMPKAPPLPACPAIPRFQTETAPHTHLLCVPPLSLSSSLRGLRAR